MDGRALVMIQGRGRLVRHLPAGADLEAYALNRIAELSVDRRTIAAGVGGRARAFATCVHEMVEDPSVTLALSGPRSAGWCLDRVVSSGAGGLMAQRARWVAESGIGVHDRSVYEHQVLAKALELGATIDGLNLKNLNVAELLFRRKQLLEDVRAENVKAPQWDGWEHYLGLEE